MKPHYWALQKKLSNFINDLFDDTVTDTDVINNILSIFTNATTLFKVNAPYHTLLYLCMDLPAVNTITSLLYTST